MDIETENHLPNLAVLLDKLNFEQNNYHDFVAITGLLGIQRATPT